MSGVLRLLIVSLMFVLVACGSSGNRRRTTPPECRKDADCLLPTADGGGIVPPCHEAICVDFTCKTRPLDEGSTCNDNDDKTVRDACREEVCKGEPATCTERAGPCQKATVDPNTNECGVVSLPDGTSCDDGDLCTEADTCSSGKCGGGTAITCTAKDGCHVAGTCDPKTGKCDEPKADDGTACDDALICTENDSCVDGACKGTDIVCDDGLSCSRDSCDEALGGCQVDVTGCICETSATCDDGNVCNGTETCNLASGLCEKGTAKDCSTLSDACHKGTCDKATGTCAATAVADGVTCDDGNLCTRTDSCQKGACAGTTPVTCAAFDQCHAPGVCDAKTGACSNPAKPDKTACDDNHACSTGDVCTAGACGGAARVCNDGVACTVDGCSETAGGCVANTGTCGCTKDADCSDGNACNGTETCNLTTLTCVTGTAVNCAALTDACNTGVCSPTDGKCTAQPRPSGTTCSDGSACTQFDACSAGKCTGTAIACPTPDQCHTAGTCNPTSGVCSTPVKPVGTTCTDGLSCTTADACNAAGACVGAARVCNDGVACTVDSCTEAAGGCTTDRSACGCAKDADCNDGNACNGVETCNTQTLTCRGGTAVSCTAQTDACNTGTCNPATGACSAVAKPNGTTCNDNALCTQNDVCTAGRCAGAAVVCPAPDQCHNTRACDPANGQCTNPNKPNGTTCTDGKTCTSGDVCTNGACGGPALGCADTIACTVDSCVEPTGCAHNTAACQCTKNSDCNDGNACNGVETCNLATLTCVTGTAVSCTAQTDACNTGTCNPATGECSAVPKPNGTTCNDGALCTQNDVCTAGRCAGAAIACPAADQCHNTRSCDPGTGQCTNVAKPNGTACNDGLFCTTPDVCTAGACGGAAVTCNDGIACTVDTCTEAARGCTSSASACECTTDAECADGNACNGVETCNLATFACRPGTAVDCSRLTNVCNTGTCAPATGACSAVPKTGAACNDSNACTATDTCNAAGVCVGAGAVACAQPTNPCQVATCVAPGGCRTDDVPDRTQCNDGQVCTLNDACSAGTCTGTSRDDKPTDWGDAPGAKGAGPHSIDLMSSSGGQVEAVGSYSGNAQFAGQTLTLGTGFTQGIYLATYAENGVNGNGTAQAPLASIALAATARVTGQFEVTGAANNPADDRFVVIGTLGGVTQFGLVGNVTQLPAVSLLTPFVAAYEKNGALRWVWYGVLDGVSDGVFTIDTTTILPDGATIVAGSSTAGLSLFRGQEEVRVPGGGAWVVRFEVDGSVKVPPARVAVAKDAQLVSVRAVTGHSDDSVTLIGGFRSAAMLGIQGEKTFLSAGGVDAWIARLEPDLKLRWGGRIGAENDDRAGAVQGVEDDGVVVAVDTVGGAPTLDAAASTPLHTIAKGTPEIQLVQLDRSGKPVAASLIGTAGGTASAYALGYGKASAITLGGVFSTSAGIYDEVGFGSGAPAGKPIVLNTTDNTLLAARYELGLKRRWGVSVGGTGGGLLGNPRLNQNWDVVMAVHPSMSVTLGGLFASDAVFGVALPKTLTPADSGGTPFVTHFDSQQALDLCQ